MTSAATKALEWLPFWGSITADMLKLGTELYRIHQGEPDGARQFVQALTLDLSKRAAGEHAIDARLAAVEARENAEQRGETETDEHEQE